MRIIKCYYRSIAVLAATAITLFSITPISSLRASDHRDAPSIDEDPRADILDLFAFVNPNNTNNVILAMTVNPFNVGGLPGVAFSPDVLYQFNIDNDGDYKEDLVVQAVVSEDVPGPQQITILGPAKPSSLASRTILSAVFKTSKVPNFTGVADGTIMTNSTQGLRAFAGLRDDPFFFDFIYVTRLLGIVPGGPVTNRAPGLDFFAGFNCSALVVEIPAALLRHSGSPGSKINVWATTSRPYVTVRTYKLSKGNKNSRRFVQVDRIGKPALNTVLIHGNRKDVYNHAKPSQDIELFGEEAIAALTAVNGDANYSRTLVTTSLFPDVLTLDVTSTEGYLNGRRPEDDVINTTLFVASDGEVTTDGVDQNDVPFLSDFPFLAPPHPATDPVPARD